MIISMNAELILTMIITITSLAITIVLTAYFTNKSTTCLLTKLTNIVEGNQKILEKVARATHDIAHLTEKVASHSVVDLGLQGVKVAENIESLEEAEKLGEVVKYNPKLKVCYYRPKKGTVI